MSTDEPTVTLTLPLSHARAVVMALEDYDVWASAPSTDREETDRARVNVIRKRLKRQTQGKAFEELRKIDEELEKASEPTLIEDIGGDYE